MRKTQHSLKQLVLRTLKQPDSLTEQKSQLVQQFQLIIQQQEMIQWLKMTLMMHTMQALGWVLSGYLMKTGIYFSKIPLSPSKQKVFGIMIWPKEISKYRGSRLTN